jgi:hypothetical protein
MCRERFLPRCNRFAFSATLSCPEIMAEMVKNDKKNKKIKTVDKLAKFYYILIRICSKGDLCE